MDIKVKIELPAGTKLTRQLGLDPAGKVQMFHTQNVLRRIQRYMPYRSGGFIKLTVAQTDTRYPEIVTQAPQAATLFCGISKNGHPLNYTKTKNPLAGAHWDAALCAAEMPAMQADLKRYLQRRSG